jgi:hypothetical protein
LGGTQHNTRQQSGEVQQVKRNPAEKTVQKVFLSEEQNFFNLSRAEE